MGIGLPPLPLHSGNMAQVGFRSAVLKWLLVLCFISLCAVVTASLQCKDENGHAVDWWFVHGFWVLPLRIGVYSCSSACTDNCAWFIGIKVHPQAAFAEKITGLAEGIWILLRGRQHTSDGTNAMVTEVI